MRPVQTRVQTRAGARAAGATRCPTGFADPAAHPGSTVTIKDNRPTLARFGKATLALAALLCIAQPSAAKSPDRSFVEMVDQVALIPPGTHDSEMLAKVTDAIGFIKRMELPRAQLAVNAALQLDARNSYLHFLNGFVYHLEARQGDTQKTELAVEGYQQALRIDATNWIAQEFLGLA